MNDLRNYIDNKMSMSHIYQPVMIKTLLLNEGVADKTEIARAILSFDQSQVEYYEKATNNMVGKVLRNNGVVQKDKNTYSLVGYGQIENDVQDLIALCDLKIQEYIEKRGMKMWEHRRRNRKAVPGSIRYQVLKRAKGRCELCGVSKDEKALEVDHIVPKNLGGEDSIDNYQSLCYTCNANKRDTDDTDFRNLDALYDQRDNSCVFCSVKESHIIDQSALAIAGRDKYPVTHLHSLIIPKRHCSSFFDLSQAEINGMNRLAHNIKEVAIKEDNSISGFNIGFNVGTDSGQTVDHCHMHIIPRRKGDIAKPTGGIRNIIPGKGDYLINLD